MGFLGRYLSGLCVATLGLCAAGWLLLTPLAFGDPDAGLHGSGWHSTGWHSTGWQRAALADRATGGGLAVVSLLTLACWVLAWRRKLRADGALPATSRRQARREARDLHQREHETETDPANAAPDPAQVLSELRALLIPLLAEAPAAAAPSGASAAPATPAAPAEIHHYAAVPQPRNEQESFGMLDGFQPVPADLDDFQHAPDAARGYPIASDAPSASTAPAEPSVSPEPPVPSGIAAIESMLAGAELLTVGCGEEEAW
jgi:hypothetical protein